MPAISFQHVSKEFGQRDGSKAAVRDISFEVEEGEFCVLLGPSGCGKTTLMRMVNRLIEPTGGRIFVGGREIHDIPETDLRRHIGYVIQQVGLFPHMSVADNIAVVPKLLGWDKKRINQRINELLELVALPAAEYRTRYPRQLSGGQQQRIGIARALAADPAVLLMDEPFGAIDAITRHDLQNALIDIKHRVPKTVIFVTHDVDEALRLADRIVVMQAGAVLQYDTPLHILERPANHFVESLLGTDDVFRQLSLIPVSTLMEPLNGATPHTTVNQSVDARSALSTLISSGEPALAVTDDANMPVGRLTLQRVLSKGAHPQEIEA